MIESTLRYQAFSCFSGQFKGHVCGQENREGDGLGTRIGPRHFLAMQRVWLQDYTQCIGLTSLLHIPYSQTESWKVWEWGQWIQVQYSHLLCVFVHLPGDPKHHVENVEVLLWYTSWDTWNQMCIYTTLTAFFCPTFGLKAWGFRSKQVYRRKVMLNLNSYMYSVH